MFMEILLVLLGTFLFSLPYILLAYLLMRIVRTVVQKTLLRATIFLVGFPAITFVLAPMLESLSISESIWKFLAFSNGAVLFYGWFVGTIAGLLLGVHFLLLKNRGGNK